MDEKKETDKSAKKAFKAPPRIQGGKLYTGVQAKCGEAPVVDYERWAPPSPS